MVKIDNLLVMMEFLKEEEISTKKMKGSYDEENNTLSLNSYEKSTTANISQNITVQLDEENNSILIKKHNRVEYDFHTIGNDFMTNYETYKVNSVQTLTKFIVEDNQLNVYRASFSQTIKEDTMGGGTIELYMDDFSDFSRNNIPIEKESYMIFDGYKITDGLSGTKRIGFIQKVYSKK